MSHNLIDDQDLSRVKYHGQWLRGGGPSEHQGTVASSTIEGDYFTVSFYGTTITAFGTIDATSGGVLTNYSIDGASPDQVTSQAGGGDTYDQQFWRSGSLSVGNHELKVTMIKLNHIDSEPNEGTIWFDYFKTTDPTIRADSASTKRHIGGIVGGVLGGVIVLGALLTAWVMLRRNQRKGGGSKHGHERLPESEKRLSNMPSGHEGETRNMGGRGAIRPFIDPPSDGNPNSRDQTNLNSTSPITPTTPITPSGVVPPQKLLQELSRNQAQISSSSSSPTNAASQLRGTKHINLASLSTLTSTSARSSSIAPGEEPGYGSLSSAAQTSQSNDTSSPLSTTVRLSPIFLAAPERPSPSATLTAKQEAIISTTTSDRNSTAQESFEGMIREEVHGPPQAASRPHRSDLVLEDDRQGQAPIIIHVDSGVRGQAGGSDTSLTGPDTAIASPIPIELPPVYSPV